MIIEKSIGVLRRVLIGGVVCSWLGEAHQKVIIPT